MPGFQTCQMTRVILDSRTKPRLTQHLHIKIGSLCDPLRLDQFVISLEILNAFSQFFFNGADRPLLVFF